MSRHRLVIVGGGLASARAIKSYREAGGDGRVALISRDDALPYHRPPLSKRYLRGDADASDTLVESDAFYAENDVELVLEATVARVDPREDSVVLDDGHRLRYERLLLATGAKPRRPDVPGAELPGVFTLRTLADATAIREAAADAYEAVVVGGGFIGMEVAASLRQLALEVTLVHRESGLFQHVRAPELEHDLVVLFRDNGVRLMLPDEVAGFGGHSHVDAVETATRETVAAELVVVGVGVDPVVDFLAGSGIKVDNGVVVDERFRSTVDNVYAVGDVANFFDPLYRRRRRIEHWSNASYQGSEVGKILATGEGRYDSVSSFFTEIFGVTLKVFGDLSQFDELETIGSLANADLVALYGDGGRLVAALTSGVDEGVEDLLKEEIRSGESFSAVRALVSEAHGSSYAALR